jgi:hypothetical protein
MILLLITTVALWALQLEYLREQRDIPTTATPPLPTPPPLTPPESPRDNQMAVPYKEAA